MCLHRRRELQFCEVCGASCHAWIQPESSTDVPFCTRICAALVLGFLFDAASSFFFILHICVCRFELRYRYLDMWYYLDHVECEMGGGITNGRGLVQADVAVRLKWTRGKCAVQISASIMLPSPRDQRDRTGTVPRKESL